jgi:hypothetical protein
MDSKQYDVCQVLARHFPDLTIFIFDVSTKPMFESSFCKQLEKEELAHDPFCECFRIVASLFELVLCMIKNVQDRFRDELSLNPILSFNDGLMWKAPVRSRFAQDSHFRIIILFSK